MQKPQYLNESQIRELAQDPRNRVYGYTYDTPIQQLSSEQVGEKLKELEFVYNGLRAQLPEKSDKELRDVIKQSDTKWDLFCQSHKRIFQKYTNRDTTAEEKKHIRYMLYVRAQQEAGNISQVQAQETVQNYLIDKFKTGQSLAEYRAQERKEKAEEEERRKKCPRHGKSKYTVVPKHKHNQPPDDDMPPPTAT